MIGWSVALGVLGVSLSALLAGRYRAILPVGEADRCWLIGLFGLFPAWLVAIWGLLGTGNMDSPSYTPPRALIISSAAALIGVIVSDYFKRRFAAGDRTLSPAASWLLGLAALVPAWAVALWNLR
ncbi:MAG: hypothetical protein HYV04_00530 [Deltaproteobacteria bacterium]|nr:hypothetical protein [Deltaproteobacteria bacterium]